LQRNRSEQTLVPRRRNDSSGGIVGRSALPKTTSQPQLTIANDDLLNEHNLRRLQSTECADCGRDDSDDSDDDGVTKQRIIKWLIGVEGNAEKPDSPLPVVDEGPSQTDTAIHIVYEEH
jgi:hypothetical protein